MSVQQKQLECSWDADLITFWDASLKSYKTCHEAKEQCVDSEKVTADLIASLPHKVIPEPTNNKRKIDQVDQMAKLTEAENQDSLYQEQLAEEHGEEEQYNEWEEELYDENEGTNQEELKEEYYNEFAEEPEDVHSEEHSSKKAKYTKEQQYQQPTMPPMPENDDGLSNMIMAWYYAGYYTGLYQAARQ